MQTQHQTIPVPDALHAYTWRPITRQDGLAMHQLLMDCEAVDHRGRVDTLEDRELDFSNPESDLETDTLAAFTADGRMAGFGWVFAPHGSDKEILAFPWGQVHPNHRRRGLGSFILDWSTRRGQEILEQRPGEKPRCLRIYTAEKHTDRHALYAHLGYQTVRSTYQMRRDLSLPIPEAVLPEGISMVHWTKELDENVWRADNEAFHDHWGVVPIAAETWKALYSLHPYHRPDLSWLALDDTSEDGNPVAGFCINQVRKEDNAYNGLRESWIQDLAVRRPWRKRGIATALLCASMVAFREAGLDYAGLGVDAENLTGALRLYERLGFEVVKRELVFQRDIA